MAGRIAAVNGRVTVRNPHFDSATSQVDGKQLPGAGRRLRTRWFYSGLKGTMQQQGAVGHGSGNENENFGGGGGGGDGAMGDGSGGEGGDGDPGDDRDQTSNNPDSNNASNTPSKSGSNNAPNPPNTPGSPNTQSPPGSPGSNNFPGLPGHGLSTKNSNGNGSNGANKTGNPPSPNNSNGNQGSLSPPPQPPCGSCIGSSDPRLVYSSGWTLVAQGTQVLHRTDVAGSSVQLQFNGTAIVVFGIVPQNNATTDPPVANYTIDGGPPSSPPVPSSKQELLQPLFTSEGLNHNVTHNITILITDADTPYTLSHFFVNPVLAQSSGNPFDAHFSMPHGDGKRMAIILGSVLGSIIFFMSVSFALYFFLKRRRRLSGAAQPWRRNFPGSSSGPTLTSSASILQNYSQRDSSFYPYNVRETRLTVRSSTVTPSNAPPLPTPPPLPAIPGSPPARANLQFVPPSESVSAKNWI
ncbi:hypothetical protein BV25DRAFT_1243584 [Artomyces pyxidatus]|uniref:Uncharacterized protein n=1 Tax=Artomyces pyxidatus TaxID=48021 RepID=A0ACB8TED5_9AGAM|nr:hypothetical protein BV25DRAFT_1243584 [Artomyces pyxidatus]